MQPDVSQATPTRQPTTTGDSPCAGKKAYVAPRLTRLDVANGTEAKFILGSESGATGPS